MASAHEQWYRLRLEMYKRVRQHVAAWLGPESPTLTKYREEFDRPLRTRKWVESSREALVDALNQARLIWLGDFHAMDQSQRGHLRLLKSLDSGSAKVLALECISADSQTAVDRFLAGEISEESFLQSVRWGMEWGFPWSHYRPLFQWAIDQKVPILALNQPTKRKSRPPTLRQRDVFAAKLLAQVLRQSPHTQVVVIYGEWHLAAPHLPKRTQVLVPTLRRDQQISVWQNCDPVYFQLARQGRDAEVDVVQWSATTWGVLSVPPWVKWQSYLMYLEQQIDSDLPTTDLTDQVAHYLQILAQFFNVPVNVESLAVYAVGDETLQNKLESLSSPRLRRYFLDMVRASRSFVSPELGLCFLGKASVNEAASLAMQFLHMQLSRQPKTWLQMPEHFQRQIFAQAMAYVGAKIINPKLKTDTVQDLRARMESFARGRPKGARHSEQGREVLQLALQQRMREAWGETLPPVRVRYPHSYTEAARILGGLMGERISAGLQTGLLGRSTLLQWLKKSGSQDNFPLFYAETLQIVEGIPEPFQTKTERL